MLHIGHWYVPLCNRSDAQSRLYRWTPSNCLFLQVTITSGTQLQHLWSGTTCYNYAVKAFRHLLLGARHKFLIWSDHENLKYFKSPQKISARQAKWHVFLQDYNFELVYFPGKSNTIADLLSRRMDFKGGVNPNLSITLLPEKLFVRKVYLEDNPETRQQILKEIHNAPVGGHPGISNTWDLVNRRYEGPNLHKFVEDYVRGCNKC